jgi:hypothetical protein
MGHFICEGDCKHVSENAGICQADFCNKKGEELRICGCEDGNHETPHATEEAALQS